MEKDDKKDDNGELEKQVPSITSAIAVGRAQVTVDLWR